MLFNNLKTVVLAVSLLLTTPSLADTFPSGFSSETIVSGLSLPTDIAFASGNRIFISTRSGIVRLVVNGVLQSQPFADLSSEVGARGDRGMLGIAVHPSFPSQPYVYLLYTHDPAGVTPDTLGARVSRLMRVTADASQGYNVALTAASSRLVLLGKNSTLANIGDPLNGENLTDVSCQTGAAGTNTYIEDCIPADSEAHSIGSVRFGIDGRLYVSVGDASSASLTDPRALRAQDLDSLAGKILRIDAATGAGLSDNPFYNGNPNANRSKVYSYGVRNAFRFAQHPTTGAFYFGDVGWNDWEEINTGRGENFGWPCYEGDFLGSAQQASYATSATTSTRCQQLYAQGASAVEKPIIAYNHNGSGAAVILGPVYSGAVYPEAYRNALFYADYNTGVVRAAKLDASGNVISDVAFGNITATTGLFAGSDSDLYYISYGDGTGAIRRLRYSGGGAPVARVSASPLSGTVPLTVNFTGSASSDPDGQALTYAWSFGPAGAASTSANPSYTYTAAGSYTAKLTVTDTTGLTSTAQTTIIVGSPPVITLTAPAVGTLAAVGQTVSFSASATDLQDGSLSNSIRWTATLVHNTHQHIDVISLPSAAPGGTFVYPDHGQNTYIVLCANVADSSGLGAQVCREIRPKTVNYTFNTSPQGLQIVYDGLLQTAPFTASAIVNSQVDVSVPSPQQGCRVFANWSDGGASASRRLLIGSASVTLTANFDSTACGGGGGGADLIGHWKFDEGSGSAVSDSSGNGNTGTLMSVGWIAGITGTAANLYGESVSHVRVPPSASLNSIANQFTIAAYAYRHGAPSGLAVVASRQNGSGSDDQWMLALESGRPFFQVRTATGPQTLMASAALPLQQWVHLAGLYDGVNMRLYVNGVQVGAQSKTGNVTVDTSKPLLIGGNQNNSSGSFADLLFDGRVDEVRLYKRALSATEIQTLAGGAPPPPPPSNTPPTVSLTSPANGASFAAPASIALTASASDANGSVTKVEFFNGSTKLGESTAAPYQFTWNNVGQGSYSLTARATDNGGASTTSSAAAVTVGAGGTLVGRWKFNEGSGSSAADSSGFGNTGRLINTGWASGRSGAAVNLLGYSRSHVRIANSPSLSRFANAITVAAWVRMDAYHSGNVGVVTRQFGNGTDNSFFLGFADNRYSFRVRTSAGEREARAGLAGPFSWLHVVGTYDGSIIRLYVNGTQAATISQSSNLSSTTKPVIVGGNQNDTATDNAELLLNGRVDDARLYDRALSASEVRALYDLGAQ